MKQLPLNQLGPREFQPGIVDFGILLPWISANDGNRLFVKIIHEQDQFIQRIQPLAFEMQHGTNADYGDFWAAQVDLNTIRDFQGNSHFGLPGRHVYRFELHNPNAGILDWIIDPFAREYAIGKLSAFTLGYTPYAWSAAEQNWKTPALHDLILYELNLAEFSDSLEGGIDRLGYLADLGVNTLSLMPVNNVSLEVDWGYLPLGFFGVDERFGRRDDFQRFVDAAHQHGLAVIVDAVYGHTGGDFPYADLYRRLGYNENPFMGPFAKDYFSDFGVSTDFNRALTRDFFYSVNLHWLNTYHIDGFRYDCVPNYWDGALGAGYANLVFNTHEYVKSSIASLPRFDAPEGSRLIQIAEQLEAPEQILEQSYSNATWQNASFGAASACARGIPGALENLGHRLGALGYIEQTTQNGETFAKLPLQYIENHDHSRFVCEFGLRYRDWNPLFAEGDRSQWYRLQPYLIALLAAKGIPMLWQGQEFGENYFVPDSGLGRVLLLRPLRWDYFYDAAGKSLVRLTRSLLSLRKNCPELRRGGHYFHNDYEHYLSRGILLFQRDSDGAISLIAVNFTNNEQHVPFVFSRAGNYTEQLHNEDNFIVSEGETRRLLIPSNYGRVWRSA
ncbi:1,4-alpha-glucan branching enzyme [Nitrosospira sp. Nsp14]|uniref:alpha-amylase family glycosyl hydrolase n=1 Tax=Nitrosospira sp. Nsp14 TaxID=1855333 RepID=UPI0008E07F6F|nr:alpha-amylase family glycosyl hydrolase [Nitrosospira sp. Nsp14]SFH22831.1 1,4-alpha-glucan branching enzyme [Nitrosospira sp. Nsp14]